jgi:Kdo2-lipid IVA lauroyltransferase/acyltransferase
VKRNRVVEYLVYLIVRILICIVQAMRLETGQRLGRQLAWWFSEVLGIRRGVVDENLRHAFPSATAGDRRRLARQMWEHLFLLVIEVAHAPRKIHETNWRRYGRLAGVAPLVQTLIDDRPTVIVTGHFGNFEMGGFLLGLLGFPSFTVARTLDNRYLDRFVNEFRGATGQYIISKKGGFDEIQAVMARGGTMAFLADQYAGAKGCWVEFFGRPASAHKAIALLAVEHDAPMTICYCRRLGSPMQFEMGFGGKADPREAGSDVGSIRDLTQWYTARLEEAIRRAPDQYWWLHRRWKDPRPARRKAA